MANIHYNPPPGLVKQLHAYKNRLAGANAFHRDSVAYYYKANPARRQKAGAA
ncbi:hypothetical protein [Paenibacillus sp. FSL H8-0537]|uniref:hypothetical protein n=1 Tax=Paenibacillus sp. FSL H8-0537 TaxID=2921399 RepID=UPI003100B6E0